MIDTREYETTEDLVAAMQLEADIARLEAAKNAIENAKLYMKRLEYAIDMLEKEQKTLTKHINDYWKGVHERGKNYKRYENRSQWYDARHY